MNAKLFINYRREDTGHAAGRLYDRLIAHFGEDQVFIDIDQIEPGEDFVEVINRKVGACDIAIVAIGPNWLHATDASGKRRLDDEEDFVRMEIVAALQRKIRVIPVLVGGARMPGRHDLPGALAPLSRRNAIELSETRFHPDVNRLISAIEKSFAIAEKEAELSPTPTAPPPEAAALRPPEPESKDFPERSGFTNPAEPGEPKEIDGHAVSGAAPVSPGETTKQLLTQAAPPNRESERSQQDSVATAKDSTTPVKSTQTTPAARVPEPEPKVLPEPSESTKPGEAKECKEVDGDASSEAAPVSLGETTKQFPTQVAPPYRVSERTQQDSVATVKDSTATPWIAALKVWTSEHRILVSAILVLGLLALAGVIILPDQYRKARDRKEIADLQKRADQGDAFSQWALGFGYETGTSGLSRDSGKAAVLYQKAADQGYASAQCWLGKLYEEGDGVPKDLEKAVALYRAAAAQGDGSAIQRLKALSR